MAFATCKRCDRIYNKIRRDICPACAAEEDKAFPLVRGYLRDHRDAGVEEVVEATGVDMEWIVSMIRDGRLILRDNPNMGYSCERCGKMTQSGRYCAACSKELAAGLRSASDELGKKVQDENPNRSSRYFTR